MAVVAAWQGKCPDPDCEEEGAIYQVHDRGHTVALCTSCRAIYSLEMEPPSWAVVATPSTNEPA